MAKMKVQVMRINSVQKSSKSELSSGTFDLFKVFAVAVRIAEGAFRGGSGGMGAGKFVLLGTLFII